MAITAQQIQAAEAVQRVAAHDGSPGSSCVAGPGTGKSFSNRGTGLLVIGSTYSSAQLSLSRLRGHPQ
jgi:hypothetical protein